MKLAFIKVKEEKYAITNLKEGLGVISKTQKDLARALGVSDGKVRSINAGFHLVTKEKFNEIKNAFDLLNNTTRKFELECILIFPSTYKVTNLNRYIYKIGIKPGQLAALLEVSPVYISKIIAEKQVLTQEKLDYLTELLEEIKQGAFDVGMALARERSRNDHFRNKRNEPKSCKRDGV